MQSVHAGWAGRTFAPPRCGGDSRGKKPRSRRTKEARKAMVESFIKKYQSLNNGKFPSLNLTHKEVGGSFYTVREIMRDIIQENRVLGPGHSKSKQLNLEYCPDEIQGDSLAKDISAPLSISTMGHAINQRQGETFTFSDVYGRARLEIIETDESANKECRESHSNTSVSQSQYYKIPNGIPLNEKLLSHREVDTVNMLQVANENSGVCEQTDAEIQIIDSERVDMFEQSVPSGDTASTVTLLFDSVVNDDESTNKNAENSPSDESISLKLSKNLSEAHISLDSRATSASACGSEDPPLSSDDAKTSYPGKTHMEIGDATSVEESEIPKTSVSDSNEVAFIPFGKDSVTSRSEDSGSLLYVVVDDMSASTATRQFSVGEDFVTESSGTTEKPPSTCDDEVLNGRRYGSVLQNLDSPAIGSTSSPVDILSLPKELGKAISDDAEAPGKSIRPVQKENTFSEVKHQQEHALGNIKDVQNSDSLSQHEKKKSETTEPNPVWSALKAFITAVIKFWK